MTINKRQDAGYKVWEVDLLLEQIKSLEAKNTDLLQEWSVQAVECQELEKELAQVKAFKNDVIETARRTTSFWYDKWYAVTHK